MRRGDLAVAAATVVLWLGAAACTTGTSGTDGPTTPSAAATTSGGPTPTGFQGDLLTLLLGPPAGASPTRAPDSSPDGHIGLARAAQAAGFPPERMEAAGFVAGAESGWTEPDGTWVGVVV